MRGIFILVVNDRQRSCVWWRLKETEPHLSSGRVLSLSFCLAIIDNVHRCGYYIDRHRVCAYIKVSRHGKVCANTPGGRQHGIPRQSCVQKSLTITIEARTQNRTIHIQYVHMYETHTHTHMSRLKRLPRTIRINFYLRIGTL